MENKSNSLSRVERHQREKVLRFSIRKYSFGAASVAVAALMFLGARVASADSVIENNSQNTTDVVKQKDKDKSLAEIQQPTDNKVEAAQNPSEKEMATNIESVVKVVDKANLRKVVEELNATLSSKSNLDNSVISPIKDRVQKGQALLDSDTATQKDVNDLLSLLENDLTVLSNATKESSKVQETTTENKTEIRDNKTASELSEADKTISDKKESLKLSAEQLQAAVLELPEHESTKEVFEKANEVLSLAQGLLTNTRVTSNELEDLNNRVKRTFNSVKIATLRLTSGKNDPRNGYKIEKGTNVRAASISSRWTNKDNLLTYQHFYGTDGSGNPRNGDRQFVENKVDMTARIQTIGGQKYVVYDVFFNNDGRNIADAGLRQVYRVLLQPKILDLAGNGAYNGDTITDLSFEIYRRNNQNEGGTLSQNPEKFHYERTLYYNFLDTSERTQHGFTYLNSLGVRAGRPHAEDMKDVFKENKTQPVLEKAVKLEGKHSGWSYGIGLRTNDKTAAVHMHFKAKLSSGVTDEAVRQAFTVAVATNYAPTAHQSYAFVSGKESSENVEPTVKQSTKYPIIGQEVIKKVDESLGNLNNPVESGFVKGNNGSKTFPNDTSWSWPGGKPSTGTAGVFQRQVKATYNDNTSNTTTATLKVIPHKPAIDQSSVNEKAGKAGQTVTVNVGNGVPKDSIVTLYSDGTVIGTGKTNGTTATITVSKALPSTAITAETVVNNGGTVTSERSNPVTPTPERDRVAPTVKIVDKTSNNTETVLTDNVSNAPTIDVYRGANIELPLKYYDNNAAGKVNIQYVSGLPSGVSFNQNASATIKESGKTENAQGSYTVRGRVGANAPLGISTVALKVSDAANGDVNQGNKKEVKFRVRVLDLDFEQGVSEQTGAAKISREVELNRPVGDPNNYLTVNDGSQRNDRLFPSGMTFRYIRGTEYKTNLTYTDPGKYTVKAAAFYPTTYVPTNGESVTATNATGDKVDEIRGRAYIARDIEFRVKPTAPTVTPENNGDVTVTPVNEKNVNTFSFTYNEPNNSPKTVTATKTNNGWTLSNAPADGVTIDKTTGKVTIKDRAIKDSAPVIAISKTTDNVESDPVTKTSNVGDNEPPKFKFTPNGKETRVETGVGQVAYITPTEDTNLKIGTVTDNSGKLSEVKFADKSNRVFGIQGLGSGITYNEVTKTNNGDVDAPRDIIVSGKLPDRNGNSAWTDNVEITRFVVAKDAALKEMRDQTENVSNPTRVKLKVLTQATKYDPHVGNQVIDKDITASGATVTQAEFDAIKSNITFTSERGDVKISNGANNRTAGLNITMNDNGAIKKNATNGLYYVSARIEYPDHTTEDIEIPVSKSDTTAPKVTINGKELSETATDYSYVVFKESTFNPTFKVSDDKNKVTNISVTGLPSGMKFEKSGSWSKDGADVQVEGNNITATNNAQLGDHEASIVVKDALNNEKTYKFKYKVVDVAIRETPKTVPLNTQLEDSHNYVKVVDGTNNDGEDKYYPAGMSFKWKKGTAEVANGTRLSRPGIISEYKPEVKFRSGAGYYTETIDGKKVKVYTPAKIEREQTFHVKPTAPTITPLEKGDVTVTPVSEENVNRLNFTYKHPNGQTTITVTATKTGNRWSLTSGAPADGVTIDPETGVVTIKDRAIKDATEITAKSVTTDSVDSDTTTANSKAGDKEPPKFEFTPNNVETKVETNGDQVVYVTPTEDTNLTIGRVTDDSNKLTEVRIALGQTFNIGLGEGLSYNEAVRKSNVELDAPRDVTISGNLGDYKTGTTKWTDNDEVTRYVVAKDAATNEMNNQTNDVTNKTRIKFKVLTQATKYDPQVSTQPINVDVTAPGAKISQSDFDSMKSNLTFTSTRGTVKISNNTTGLSLAMKEDGAIKPKDNGTYYVGATITYPDHSTEDIEIPVTKVDANEPIATMDGMLLTKDENTTANFVVFRGSTFNPTFNVRDDRNDIKTINVTKLPNGTSIEKNGPWTSGTNVKITEAANTSTSTADLGERVGEVTITDATGNTGTYKYKYKVVDVEVRNSPETVELGTKLVDAANANNGKDSHNYVKLVSAIDGTKQDVDDKYYPAGMNFKWSQNNEQGTTGEVTTTTELNKPGVVTDYKALVKFPRGAGYYTTNIDGKAVKVYTPASIEKEVTFHVAPPKPTFNQDAVSSTTRKISGTLGGFTLDNNDRVVEVRLNDKDNTVLSSKDGQVTINGDTWTATLPDGVKLRQSENKNGETVQPAAITVVNKVGNTDVSKTSEPKVVKMGNYSPSATIAGSKHIDVTVPHDAKRIELRFHNSTDSDNTPNSIVLVRNENGGDWQVDSSTATAGVTNANNFVQGITNSINEANKAENKVSIALKESDNNKKLLIKEEVASGDNTDNYTSGLGLRVDYKPETGQNATPAGNWKVISVSNDAPVVTLKDAAVGTQENPKVYDAGTVLTADKLKELVTVSDTEDDRTTDKPFGTGTVNVTGLPANPTAGVYAVTLQPVDSQGKAGNQVTVHVVVKEEKPAAPTISQWQNGNVKVTPPTDGDKVTIPLTDGTVTLVKKDSGWELETPKEGLVFHNGSLEIPKKLVGTSVTVKATKGTGGSAVDSDDATYTPTPHKVTTVDVIKEVDSPLTNSDLSGKTGVTGVVDGTETKDFTAAKITSVVGNSELPKVTPDSKHTIPVTITYEDGSTETTDVIVKVKPQAPIVTPKENGTVEITPILTGEGTTTITYTGEDNTPQTVTVTKAGDGTWTSSDPKITVDANGKVTIPADKVKDGSPVTAKVTSKTTDLTSQSSTETAGKPLTVEVGTPVDAIENKAYTSDKVVTPNKDNSTITPTPKNGLTVTPDGKVTGTPDVKDWGEIEEHRTVTIKVTVTHDGDTPVEKDVVVNVLRDTDGDGTPDKDDLDDDNDGIPDDQDKNPKVADELTGNVTPPAPVREKAEVPPVTVVTTNKPGATITTENPPVNGLSVNGNGELTGTPTVDNWDRDEEERQINIPVKITKEKDGKTGKETEEIKVEVPVTILRDTDGDGTPDKEDADDDNDEIPDEEEKKNGTDPKAPTTQTPTIGITRKENGDAVVTPTKPGGGTYPPGTKVVIPGDNNTTIEVVIGNDGSGTVPNDKLPKTDKSGTGTVTEPNKAPSKPVEVTTPARKPSTIELEQDPKTGDVTVTPTKPDGTTYPSGTIVKIPGKNGTPIVVEIGEGGKGTVSNNDLPDSNISGPGAITEPGTDKPVENVTVETPARLTPAIVLDQDPKTGDVTVTPKKPDGTTYPPGTKVEIPGKNGTPIVVTTGPDGKVIIPNKDLPDGEIPGTGKITPPGKPSVEVNVKTPKKLDPNAPQTEQPGEIEITRKPNGDAIVTPTKPGGGIYPPGTKVVIPGDNNTPIEVIIGDNGSGEVPNDKR